MAGFVIVSCLGWGKWGGVFVSSESEVEKRNVNFYTTLLVVWLLVLLNLLIFGQSIRFDFVAYDDGVYVTKNETVLKGLSDEGLRYAFTSGDAGAWHPITWLSHMTDVTLFGARPWGHHLTNVLFHLANGLALYFCLFKLTGSAWRAGVVAIVFAIHPQRAESVAWVADRKDLLCGFFFF